MEKEQTHQAVLRYAVVSMFVGWGLLHLFADIPYRTYLWSQLLFGWFIEGILGISWDHYVTSPIVDGVIQNTIRGLGVVYLAMALIAWKATEKSIYRKTLGYSSFLILILALLYFKEAAFRLPMFFEFSSQILAPVLLAMALGSTCATPKLLTWLKIATALTFAAHGLYAIGFYPVPGHFIDMVITSLGTNEPQARMILKIAGGLDLALCGAMFWKRTQTMALAYAFGWGLLTALARPMSYIEVAPELNNMPFWFAQALYRAPHALLPLGALALIYQDRIKASQAYRFFAKSAQA